MSEETTIVCKPTRWFLIRALAMLGMFGMFTVWFYYDAQIGYRAKNEAFYLKQAFEQAVTDFTRLNPNGTLTEAEWKEHAAGQFVKFPEDPWVLPTNLQLPMPWPDILQDFEKVRGLNASTIWVEHTGKLGISDKVPEKPYDVRKIRDQWVVMWVCLALSVVSLFFLIRTLMRKITVDDEAITAATGKRVAFEDLTLLDLRKWDTKGIAHAEYQSPTGKGRIRIDGLTYGGFRHEDEQPAERMMERLRANFSGEILEYTVAESSNGESETALEESGNDGTSESVSDKV